MRLNKHRISQDPKIKNQNGNVFIIIMLGVFLFGALMFFFARGTSQGTGNLTKQQAKIAAQEILNYARLIEGGVDRVRRNGCSESEISFENSVVAGYSYDNGRTDNACNVFEEAGGKATYSPPVLNWLDENQSSELYYNENFFPRSICVAEVGTGTTSCNSDSNDNEEMMFILPYLDRNICLEINQLLGKGANIIQDGVNMWHTSNQQRYVGSFSNGYTISDGGSNDLSGVTSYCVEGGGVPAAGTYHFYHVLLAR